MTSAYALNCSLLFAELPLLARPTAARAAGFEAVEFWWPWPGVPVPPDAEVDAFCQAIEDAGVRLIALNLYAGDMAAGERGVLSDPSRTDEFRASLPVTLRIAERTGVRQYNALYGQRRDGLSPDEQDRTADANIAHAAREVGGLGGTILIEPLARGLNGAYPLETAADAIAVVERAPESNVKLLFDCFHLVSNGDDDLPALVAAHADHIGHVQIADAPGRGRPGTGSIGFPALFGALDAIGYDGWIALEYKPDGPTTAAEFAWIRERERR